MNLVHTLLTHGVEDWVSAREVYGIASRSGATDPAVLRALAIGLITEVLVQGLMIPGDVRDSFQPWDAPTGDAIVRITRDWLTRADPVIGVGEIVWLNNSDAGETLGLEVIRCRAPHADNQA